MQTRTKEACERLHQALRNDASRASEWAKLADWAEELEDHELYDAAVAMLLERAPQFAATYGYQHTSLLRQGKREEAKDALRHALSIDREYEYGLRFLFEMHMEDEENRLARELLEQHAQATSPETVLPYRLTLECAECNADLFMHVLDEIGRVEECDYGSYVNYVFERVDESSCQSVLPPLTERMKTSEAEPAVGTAWECACEQVVTPDVIVDLLKDLPKSPAWHAATQQLVQGMAHFGMQGPDEFTMALLLLHELVKQNKKALLADANTWTSLSWAFVQLCDFESGVELAGSFKRIPERTTAHLVPAILSAMNLSNWGLMNRLLVESTRSGMEARDEIGVFRAVYALFRGSPEAVAVELAEVDLCELGDWFQLSTALMTTGLEALESGDETPLVTFWKEVAEESSTEFDEKIYHRLRFLIAKRNGRWLATLQHYWKSR